MAYRNLVETCRSEATKKGYVKVLGYFMAYLNLKLEPDSYDRLLEIAKLDPKLTQVQICDFVSSLKKRGAAYATISMYIAALNKFYSMNDVTLNWKKVNSYMGEHELTTEDRPYDHSEIATLLQNSSARNRAIILIMCSAGLRIGAIPFLRIKDLEPIDKYQIYKVTVYAKSKRSTYFSFCTPEARKHIDGYLEHRKRWGERLNDDSPLFRTDYNPQAVDRVVKPIGIDRVRHIVDDIVRDTGLGGKLRKIPTETSKYKRSPVMTNHGMRKFFEQNAYRAGMDHMYIRRLMGQKSGLEDAYLKLSDQDLLEGDSRHVGLYRHN